MTIADGQSLVVLLHHAWAYGKQAVSGATAIMSMFGFAKLCKEHSARGKRSKIANRMTEHSMYLQRLEQNLRQIPDPETSHPGLTASLKRARQEELDLIAQYEAASEVHRPKTLAKWRRAFLLYMPATKWGWVSHFLFFGFWINLLISLHLDTSSYPDSVVVGAYFVFVNASMAFFANRWANFSINRAASISQEPSQLPLGICWYPANSYVGLLAESFTLLMLMTLICNELPYFYDAHYLSIIIRPWTPTSIFSTLILAVYLSVGYFWMKAEYFIGTQSNRAPCVSDLWMLTRHPGGITGIMAVAILHVVGAISLIEFACFPLTVRNEAKVSIDGTSDLGAAAAVMLLIFGLGVMLILPWCAIFRGFSLFFSLTQMEGADGRQN